MRWEYNPLLKNMTSGADKGGSILGRVMLENELPMQQIVSPWKVCISSELLSPQTPVIFGRTKIYSF